MYGVAQNRPCEVGLKQSLERQRHETLSAFQCLKSPNLCLGNNISVDFESRVVPESLKST